MSRLRSNKGFTLIEMVITVAVMAILVSLSMPAIFDYIRMRDKQREEVAMGEIRKALEAYLSAKGGLPAETTTGTNAWYKLLAGYTSMSEDEIANDVYGRARTYVRYENTTGRSLGDTPVKIVYATVHSMGADGAASNSYKDGSNKTINIPGILLDGKNFGAAGTSGWWKTPASGTTGAAAADSVVAKFSALRPGTDDHMMRFTNYSEVLDQYNTNLQRLDNLTQALETYARSKYAERVSWCVTRQTNVNCNSGTPEKLIYYPRSTPVSSNTENNNAGTSRNVMYAVDGVVVANAGSVTGRKDDMEDLTDLLGLPRDHCCSALTGEPFYYFSNPRPRSASGCGARPQTISTTTTVINEPKLPARVTTVNDATTCG